MVNGAIRLGVVGCGHLLQKAVLAHLLCDDFRQLADTVALCDAASGRAASLAAQHGIPRSYERLDDMLRAERLDVVLVLTPVQLHAEHAAAALRAGAHVYVQKAMALTHADAMRLIEEAESRRQVLAAAPGQMLSPAYRRMADIVRTGGIGPVRWAYAGTTTSNAMETVGPDGIDTSWQYRYGGGALWNTSVYSFHALTGILGPVSRVSAMMKTPVATRFRHGTSFDVSEVDDALLTVEFRSGALGMLWGCRSAGGAVLDWGAIGVYGISGSLEATAIHMESGWPSEVRWQGSQVRTLSYSKGGFEPGSESPQLLAAPPHGELIEQHVYMDILDFVESIRDGREPIASARHAAHVVDVIEQAYASSRQSRHMDVTSDF
ncbi:Gfo/Idh/MocA family oxidoreductase [Candidatus Poribacteria bacterium]|nr:Gfo/Idh/MocA family oxidoreductase [Candidatus Poribacteria bacterium]